jgi:hypothetical protein
MSQGSAKAAPECSKSMTMRWPTKNPATIPFLMTLGETFDVGSDSRTSVDDNDYQVPFAFNGKVDKVAVQLNRPDDDFESLPVRNS